MDFFARQDQARKKTRLLVFYFVVAVVLIITLIYFVVLFGFTVSNAQHHRHSYDSGPLQFSLWNLNTFLAAVFGTLAVVFLGSAWKTSQLSGGGVVVAEQMGGRLVSQGTADADERKLLNVVEEMSIAAGVPMPQVYVLDGEEGINAFAAGHSPSDAAIGITRGCIHMLSRDELQGVIGHEFSHILHGDMRLNLRLLGIIFGRFIQSPVSRQREFLADASSVQFTRNPGGLSGALQKIGRYSYGSKLESEHAPDLCHMFFSNGLGDPLFSLMATHPPIPDRIRAIDEAWDGKFPALKPEQFETVKRAALNQLKPSPLPGIMQNVGIVLAGTEAVEGERTLPPIIRSQNVLLNIGNLTPLHLKYAMQMRDALPENLKAAAREPLGAVALIYALLLSPDEKLRAVQLAGLAQQASSDISEKSAALFPDVAQTVAHARLPLVNLALGAL